MKKLLPLLGASAIFATAGCAVNEPLEYAGGPVVCSSYGLVDRDNNGILTQAEWTGFRSGVFNDWDVDNDNLIDRTEFQNCWVNAGFRNDTAFDVADWDDNFGVFDDDNDGFLGPNEFFGDDEFAEFDTDDDFGIEPGINEWGF